MIRIVSVVFCVALATPGVGATSKQLDCGYQSEVVAAVKSAREARVKEAKVADHVAQSAPEWPDKYDAVIPLVTPWVYSMKMSELKSADIAAAWNEMCLSQ